MPADTNAAPAQTFDQIAAELYPSLAPKLPEAPKPAHIADDLYPSLAPKKPEAETKAPADGEQQQQEKPAERTDAEVDAGAAKIMDALRADGELEVVDPKSAEAFGKVLAKRGLDADAARELLDLQAEHNANAWDKISEDWRAEAAAMPDHAVDVADAKALLRDYGTPELLNLLNVYRIGDNGHAIAFLGRVSRALKGR